MKKVLSIVLALVVLFSGLHVSMATHRCCGLIAAVKWSVTGEKATCGMEQDNAGCPLQNRFTSNCCQDYVSVCTVDHQYTPSHFLLKKVTLPLIQLINQPVRASAEIFSTSHLLCTNNHPREKLCFNSVFLESICVFRI
ncbi:MAG: hypothetical protein Q8914_12250 [Bacteroidota bacterium]|nr:hypothetical protein [Bacteroidota bacterium]